MKTIPLTRGYFAKVDNGDYVKAAAHKWYAVVRTSKTGRIHVYAASHEAVGPYKQRTILLHRFLLGIDDPSIDVDHRDHDGTNNQRENIRIAGSKNSWNERLACDNTSGRKGVYWHKRNRNWVAQITVKYKRIHIGSFRSLEDAGRAYDAAALAHFGEFACTNQELSA